MHFSKLINLLFPLGIGHEFVNGRERDGAPVFPPLRVGLSDFNRTVVAVYVVEFIKLVLSY